MNEPEYKLKFERLKSGWRLMVKRLNAPRMIARVDLYRIHPILNEIGLYMYRLQMGNGGEGGDWHLGIYSDPKEDRHFREWLNTQGKEPRHLWEQLGAASAPFK